MLTRIWTTAIVLSAAASLVAWVCVVAHARGIRPLRAMARFAQKLSLAGVIVFGLMAAPLYRAGSAKVGGGTNNVPRTSTNTTRTLTVEDFERGFVMARVGTDEAFDFAAPSNATVCADWRAFGAATDWVYMTLTNWAFRVATNDVSRLRIYSFGRIDPLVRDADGTIATNNWFVPFMASLGIVPEANWHLLDETARPSRMWHYVTPSNTLQVTWQNALLNRDTDTPLSFQIEFRPDGQFSYRYDLSRLNVDAVTNILAGASLSGNTWATNSMPTNVTSMAFYPLFAEDAVNPDPDNDGLPTMDELFVYHTDPHHPDSDYDGLTDYDELFIYSTDPLDPYSAGGPYCDGVTVRLGGLDPFAYPEGSTNTVLEHVFYSGTTNGAFAYPQSDNDTAVLKVKVSGVGTGRLIVGDSVVPLVAPPQMRSGAATNTLLLAVGKGVRKEVWIEKPDGLDVALCSADMLIGSLPTWYWPRGWLAFPHTDATVPCIHDFNARAKLVTLVHGEEFPGMTAVWQSDAQGVAITNAPPVSAEVHGSFSTMESRSISYAMGHLDYICGETNYVQALRFCPQLADAEAPQPGGGPGDGFEDAEEAYTNMVNGTQQPLADVFYLYRANAKEKHLAVPGGAPVHCCPCPEHWADSYVAKVAYTGRVAVDYSDGSGEFRLSHVPCDVTLSGVSPSLGFGDSTVVFVTNGVEHSRHNCTVLGVRFESDCNRPPLSEYNRRSPSFGYPVTVCTNVGEAAAIVLRTDVLFTNGVVRLSMLNATGGFQVWLPEWWDGDDVYHAPEILLASSGMTERCFSIGQWRGIMQRYGWHDGVRMLAVKVLSSSQGHCDLKFEYASSCGAGYVHDYAYQRITSVNPPLLPDYDRDGKIGLGDVARHLWRSVFRYWINECKVTGDVWEEPSMFQGVADALVGLDNWRNNHVDGRYDLVNLFPVAVSAEPFLDAWGGGGSVSVKVRCLDGDDVFRFTLANVGHSDAGSIRTAPRSNIAGQPLHSATMNWLTNSLTISSAQYNASFDRNSALLVCEAAKPTWQGLLLTVEVDGSEMYSFRLPMSMSTVDDMYRYVSIREAYENEMFTFSGTNAPPNNPDSELADKDVFFVHGFNVSPENARNWNREMFKRFWVSAMNARYWGVTWSGDYHLGWPNFIAENFNGLHYHRDVRQALMTAPTFRNLVNSNGVNSVVIGHSLGNMVVSEALLKNMNAKTYIMLDAAVASEAYRPELQADSDEILAKYRPGDWNGYDSLSWSANWYTWFTNDVNDARGKIGWAGHFEPLLQRQELNIYNFYSSGDEVFAESTNGTPGLVTGVFHWPTLNLDWPFFHLNLELDAFPWQKQEVFKGVNAAGSLSAGWGFHCWTTNIDEQTAWVRYSAAGANAMVADGSLVINAVFDRGVSAMFSPTISDYDKADILAFHIPAVSSPVGMREVIGSTQGVVHDFNLNSTTYRANDWGREGILVTDGNGQQHIETPWLHSDIKNMAYYYVYPAFTNIVEKGEMK